MKQSKILPTIQKLERIKREIDKTISYLKSVIDNYPRCKNCGYGDLRMLINKRYFCRRCGYKGTIK